MPAVLLLALASGSALAWNHTGWVWKRDAFPLPWYMSDHLTSVLPDDYQVEVLDRSINAWTRDAPCSELSTVYGGVREGIWAGGATSLDSTNTMYYDDPAEQNSDGALGVTYTVSTSEFAFTLPDPNEAGVTNYYYYAKDSDIVFSTGVQFYTTEQVDAGACVNGYAIEAIATHEFGHLWGMDHTCEDETVRSGECDDPEYYSATMFWQGTPCSNEPNSLDDEDISGILALYGPYASMVVVSEDTFGGVPLTVCFDVESTGTEDATLTYSWAFGDGSTSDEQAPCHTYTTKGQFSVTVRIDGLSPDCGEFSFSDRKAALVLACEAPQAAEGKEGLFTYEWVEGTTYQMVNEADLSVYGCIDRVQWDVFKGGTLVQSVSAWSPKIDFGEEGDFEVVLNLGGPGGVTAESLVISVGGEGGGCAVLPGSAGLIGLGLGLGAVARRRRHG